VDEKARNTMTVLLRQVGDGDEGAAEQLFELLYADLHREATRCLAGKPPAHTLRSTELVHEVYIKLFEGESGPWESRRHFLTVAAKAMRAILVDHARARLRAKRNRDGERVALDGLVTRFQDQTLDVLDLESALANLASEDPRAAQVVELRLFAGLEINDIAGVLRVPKRTVERDWRFARIRLRRLIG